MKALALLLLASLSFASVARAGGAQPCDAAALKVAGRFAGFLDFAADNGARVVSSACKAAPDQPGVLLAAFVYDKQPAGKPVPDAEAKELAVLVIDRVKQEVIASRMEQVEEDAATRFDQGSLSLDTARYLLAPGVRAFGLRFRSAGNSPSCVDNSFGPLLTLFITEGGALRPVLQLNVSTQRALSGCIGSVYPGAVIESAELSIGLAGERSHGFADLIVRTKISTWAADETKHLPKARTETRTLHYDGVSYAVRPEDAWWLADFGL
jgi:hypothetical protein